MQQDNARPHNSKKSIAFFEDNNIKLLPWPPYIPDLFPIETIWAILKARVYSGQQYDNKDVLWKKIQEERQKIEDREPDLIPSLYLKFKHNVCDIISSGGALLK